MLSREQEGGRVWRGRPFSQSTPMKPPDWWDQSRA